MEWAYKKVHEISKNEKHRAKVNYDKKIRCSKLNIGDICVVRKQGFKVNIRLLIDGKLTSTKSYPNMMTTFLCS